MPGEAFKVNNYISNVCGGGKFYGNLREMRQ